MTSKFENTIKFFEKFSMHKIIIYRNSITEDGMDLTLSVLEAKGLVLPFSVDSLDTFVRIYLVPDQAGALQTKVEEI